MSRPRTTRKLVGDINGTLLKLVACNAAMTEALRDVGGHLGALGAVAIELAEVAEDLEARITRLERPTRMR